MWIRGLPHQSLGQRSLGTQMLKTTTKTIASSIFVSEAVILPETLVTRMFKGGRPRDPIWAQFTKTSDKTKVVCKSCHEKVSSKADRLRNHQKKCARTPSEIVPVADQVPNSEMPPVSGDFEEVLPSKRVQSSLLGHFISTPVPAKEKLDQ